MSWARHFSWTIALFILISSLIYDIEACEHRRELAANEFEAAIHAECMAEFEDWIASKTSDVARESIEKQECREMRLIGDSAVWGRGPKTLATVENTSNESSDFIIARTGLRSDFRFYKEDLSVGTFKNEQSVADLKALRISDPRSALILPCLILELDDQDITIALEVLELKLELYELNPYCESGWHSCPSSIVRSANALIEAWRNKDGRVTDLGEETLLRWLRRAHATIMAIYEAA